MSDELGLSPRRRVPPRLVRCPSCGNHLFREHAVCAHCGADAARLRALEELMAQVGALTLRRGPSAPPDALPN